MLKVSLLGGLSNVIGNNYNMRDYYLIMAFSKYYVSRYQLKTSGKHDSNKT